MLIPNHLEDAFPWITKEPSNLSVSAPGTAWLEREIICLLFTPPATTIDDADDYRRPLIKSMEALSEDRQVSYIKAVAKCLAETVLLSPLPHDTQAWLKNVNSAAKKLRTVLFERHANNLSTQWNNLFSLVTTLLKDEAAAGTSVAKELLCWLRKEDLRWGKRTKSFGKTDLAAILNLVSNESKELAEKPAIAFYKFPRTFFNEISTDKTLYLEYQRRAIQAIGVVHQEYFSKPYEALTARVLTCIFQKDISHQKVKKIRESSSG